jgi:hypothetical protein
MKTETSEHLDQINLLWQQYEVAAINLSDRLDQGVEMEDAYAAMIAEVTTWWGDTPTIEETLEIIRLSDSHRRTARLIAARILRNQWQA